MSDFRDDAVATASADRNELASKEPSAKQSLLTSRGENLDVDALFSDIDDEPESSGSITTGASRALGSSESAAPQTPSVTANSGLLVPSNSKVQASPEPPSAPADAAAELALRSLPVDDAAEDLDLEREALPSRISSSGRHSLPPKLRGVGTPAPPMSVPSLRPPEAAPPPLRPSVPPPEGTRASQVPPSPFAQPTHTLAGIPLATGRSAEPTAPPSVRTSLPEAAPAPSLRPRGTHQPVEPEARVALPLSESEQSPASATVQTLPGMGHQLGPSIKTEPMQTIPLPLERQLPRPKPKRGLIWLLAALAIAAAILGVVMSGGERSGNLMVSVAGTDGAAVAKLSVFVDGELACSYSPCKVEGLSIGNHTVKAEAPGYVGSSTLQLEMRAGTDTVHNLVLAETQKFAALEVRAEGDGLNVLVDGRPAGPPPVMLRDLAPGQHVIRFEGHHFVPEDHTVTLAPDEKRKFGPIKLKVRTGSLTINPGTGWSEGALVTLDGKPVKKLPTTVELDGQKVHLLAAEKEGFDRFEHRVAFPDGRARLTVDVALLEAYDAAQDEEAAEDDGAASSAPTKVTARFATLSMNSIPPSVVLLDGQRVGKTPKIGVRTKPGVHSVTFVHPERGRKVQRVTIRAGQSKTVSVRF